MPPPSSGRFSKTRELLFQRYESRLQTAVDRVLDGPAVAIVVVDVESGEIPAAKNLELAGTQLIRPGSTLKPFVLMELLDPGKLDPKRRLICRRALRIGAMRLDCSHTTDVSQLDADGVREMEVTPLELLAAYRKLALRKRSGSISRDEPVFDGLEHAIMYGTAHAASVDGMKIAGKTGTASAAKGPRTHGVFVGYAPADEPQIAMVVAHSVFEECEQIKKKP